VPARPSSRKSVALLSSTHDWQRFTGVPSGASIYRKEETKMNWLNNRILKLQVWSDTNGQDLVEYALAAGMVAVAAVACMPSLSTTVNNVFTRIGTLINTNVP
jgi:pilus assembly protein Flp/PilA